MMTTLISIKTIAGDSGTWYYEYMNTVGGKDYLLEYSYTDSVINFVESDGIKLNTLVSGLDSSFNFNYFAGENNLVLAGTDKYYFVDSNGIKEHALEAGTLIVDYIGGYLITQLPTKEKTIISCLNASNGTALDTYSVLQDIDDDYSRRTVNSDGYGRYYGEAGLYVFNNDRGRLEQITSKPVLDIMSLRNDERYIILTHEPGVRVWGMNELGGNEIAMIDSDGTEKMLLGNDPAHGISIAGFGNIDGISFYSGSDVGMQHFNTYTYLLIPSSTGQKPQILVLSYTAGRPETEPENYEQTFVKNEQARLDALGY
jgi:hypothetical protein